MDAVDTFSPQSHDVGWMDSISASIESKVWTGGIWLEKSDLHTNFNDSFVD